MFTEKPLNVLLFCFIVMVTSAVLQYLSPGVSFYDSGLIIAVLLTVFLKNDSYTKLFGLAGILLVGISFFYFHPGMTTRQVLMQHLFSAMILVIATMAVLYVKKLYRSIESDERQVNALFEHATEGIILTNSAGKIVLINPAATRLFEYEKDDLLGKEIESLIPSRFHGKHEHYRQGFYKHPSNRTMGHGRDLFAKTKSGREFPVEVSLSHYRQKNENFVIAFLVDITERKKAEQELLDQKRQLEEITADMRKLNTELESKVEDRTMILREALQELERSQQELNEALNKEKELNEIKSRFVSMASHEFRTPLSTVLSSAALIGRYTQGDEQDKRDRHIKRIKDSVRHLNVLLEDFLSLGKLEEGRIKATCAPFNVRAFQAEVVDEMNVILKEGQSIEQEFTGDDQFDTDSHLLKNILINLLSNAAKFSGDNAVIRLKIDHNGNSLQVTVTDEGVGISEEDQQHLFSTFFRGKNVVNIAGTGLGLHIVKRYVELLHGTLQLTSKLDEGTCVTITIPLPEKMA
ncbi:sensor histidine kinase [Paraflavitalea soli]|nr:PAS domain-containing sensor histidine kinase [Paraflavitalea soli]